MRVFSHVPVERTQPIRLLRPYFEWADWTHLLPAGRRRPSVGPTFGAMTNIWRPVSYANGVPTREAKEYLRLRRAEQGIDPRLQDSQKLHVRVQKSPSWMGPVGQLQPRQILPHYAKDFLRRPLERTYLTKMH